jgi:hypothetical protein
MASSDFFYSQFGPLGFVHQNQEVFNGVSGENLGRRDWGRALEALKQLEGMANNEHGKLMTNDNFVVNGNVVGNITQFIRGN